MNDDHPPGPGLSQARTDLAEDRTVLANERTFASWFRTGFAAVAIGLAFQALFLRMEPAWVPRTIATLFVGLGIALDESTAGMFLPSRLNSLRPPLGDAAPRPRRERQLRCHRWGMPADRAD